MLIDTRPVPESIHALQEDAPTPFEVERVAEIKTAVLGAIFLYQATLSSQDTHRCNFSPSCSRFGATALQNEGPVKGVLLASDRLMRCNGMPDMSRHYPFDPKTGLFVDPVETYINSSSEDDEQEEVH